MPSLERFADPARSAVLIGAGRVAFGVIYGALPEAGTRMLGTDAATARRASWVARMVAVRDLALGLGTLSAARTGTAPPWLLAGALSDTGDALAVATALKQGRVGGPGAWLVVAGTPPLVGLGVLSALGLRRRR